ncbi:hypothetical protein ACWKWU_13460 [Chitinophaga lutea]
MKKLLTVAALSSLLFSCSKDDKPTQTTDFLPYSEVTYQFYAPADSVLFTWSKLPDCSYGIQIRNAKAPTNSFMGVIKRGTTRDTFSVMAGMGPDTWYYVRVIASDSVSRRYSKDTVGHKFRTPCWPINSYVATPQTTSFKVTWGAGGVLAYDVKGYTAYIREAGNSATMETIITNEEEIVFDNLKTKTKYEYKISYLCSVSDAPVSTDWKAVTTQ